MAKSKRRRFGARDWWVIVPLISVGILTFASFLYVGLRARRNAWLVASAIYLAIFVTAFAVDAAAGGAEWSSTMAGFALFGLAGGGLAHCMAIRKTFYAIVDGHPDDSYEAALQKLNVRERGRRLAAEQPDRARQMGVGRPDVTGSFHANLVDLNSAPAGVIADVCGVSDEVATRVVAARQRAGEFSSVEDLDLLVDLPPADVTRLKDAGVCVPCD